MNVREIGVSGRMKLDQLLKFSGLVSTGGEAKRAIQSGMVKVNGRVVDKRGYKLQDGDEVEMEGAGVALRVKVIK